MKVGPILAAGLSALAWPAATTAKPTRYAPGIEASYERIVEAVRAVDTKAIRMEGLRLSKPLGELTSSSKSRPGCFAAANQLHILTIDLTSPDDGLASAAKGRLAKYKAAIASCRSEEKEL